MLRGIPLGTIRNRARENRIEEGSGAFVSCPQIPVEANLSGHLSIGGTPLRWWRRKRGWQRMGASGSERGLKRLTHTIALEAKRRRHHDEVDEVFHACARSLSI
jgi:hypothetical protein